MTRHEDDGRDFRTTNTRWSVFELLGQDESGGGPDRAGPDDGSGLAGDELDPLLVAVAGELRKPVAIDAALDERVMAMVAREPRPARGPAPLGAAAAAGSGRGLARQAWRWLRKPRIVVVTPLGGLAAAAAFGVLLLLALPVGGRHAVAPAPAVASAPVPAATDTVQLVQFVLVAPGAHSVALVGDFNDWRAGATPLRAAAAGRVWSVEVPLTAGRHRYAFVVDDDSWVPDPAAPRAAGDDFGTPSSVVTVVGSRS